MQKWIVMTIFMSLIACPINLLLQSQPVLAMPTTETKIQIIDKPIKMTDYRIQLAQEYAQLHYGLDTATIIPQVIVIHWTASNNWQGVYDYFYEEETTNGFYVNQGKLNVSSQFLVDRDGTIYRLTPENFLNRHIIGLNWCSIGIENVGGVNGKEDLTEEQLVANVMLVRYLKNKYPEINYLIGHYQQNEMKQTGLWRENMTGYYSGKDDPGSSFMKSLTEDVLDLHLSTYPN